MQLPLNKASPNFNCLRWYTQWPVSDPGTRRVWKGWQECPEEHWSHPVCSLCWRGHAQSMTHTCITSHVPYHQYMSKSELDLLLMFLFLLQDCISLGTGEPNTSECRSFVLYHNNSPRWSEMVKLPIPIDRFRGSHLRFEFRHCSSEPQL